MGVIVVPSSDDLPLLGLSMCLSGFAVYLITCSAYPQIGRNKCVSEQEKKTNLLFYHIMFDRYTTVSHAQNLFIFLQTGGFLGTLDTSIDIYYIVTGLN